MIANIPVLARIKNFRWGRPATMESFGAMSVCRVAVIWRCSKRCVSTTPSRMWW